MPRKKVKISKINRKTMSLSENMENDFRAIPNKLPAQLNKELDGLKKQENKLESSLLKMQKQQTVAKNKQAALTAKTKNKLTAATKKQIKVATKTVEMLNEATLKLAAQLNEVQQHGKLLSHKQAKFSEICKFIASVDKKWEKKYAKANKPQAKVKAKVKVAQPKKSRKIRATDEVLAITPSKKETARVDVIPEAVEASSE